jgi:hypothetical protein
MTLILGVLILASSPVRADDEIRLKNGSVIHGKIVRDDKDGVTVDLGQGRMNIPRRDILDVKRVAAAPAEEDAPKNAPNRSTRDVPGNPQDAVPPKGGGTPRVPYVPPQRKKRVGPGTKVVPVERTPPPSPKPAPESTAPSRSSASRSSPSAPMTKPGQRPANAKPDW